MESNQDMPLWRDDKLEITAVSPINIALVKYWGKVDEERVIPLNSSLSMTLNTDDLCSTTTVYLSDEFEKDTLELNGEVEAFSERIKRIVKTIKAGIPPSGVQALVKHWSGDDTGEHKIKKIARVDLLQMRIKVVSTNNFPTASGVASSSSGLSCLAYCLAKIYGVEMDLGEISRLARLGSGSACRSLYGGFVMWDRGFSSFEVSKSVYELVILSVFNPYSNFVPCVGTQN